jgi:hypothetical protein
MRYNRPGSIGLNFPDFSLGLQQDAKTSGLIDALNTLKYLDLTTYKLKQIETILS